MMLSATDLKLAYRDGGGEVVAVAGVSIGVGEREFVGIVGPSGSGKSSLLYLLAGLKEPTAGEVTFRSERVTSMGADARTRLRRDHFGFVFQNPFLVGYLTAEENVRAAKPDDAGRARELLEELGVGHCRAKFPHQMSMGERQRVAIARALVHRPAIVFADEPTASLDRANADAAIACLRRYATEGALFVVTHDETILKDFSRVLRMNDGRIA
jgi:putative ABC transport system ATP-binding protein